ncbi:MAG: alpha/beta hydrolase [Gemmatimonadetes bacterium]|nr:alpha/beta hydrolase [Gemmatimonadota bacterium]
MQRMTRLWKGMGIVVGAVVVLIAAFVFSAWAPDRTVAELAPRWAPPPSQFITVNGLAMHLRDEGLRDDSLPLVLLHGTSASLHTWDGWTKALAPTHRVIRLDLPGFGLTGPTPDSDYAMPGTLAFLAGLLDSLHVTRAIFIGNSMGGAVATSFAIAHPERVAKLVLVDAAGYPMRSTSVPIGFRIARSPLLSTLMRKVLPRSIVESSVRNVYGDPSKVTPELVDRFYELTLRAGNRAAVSARFQQAPSDSFSNDIKSIHVPTLILWGTLDHLIPLENAERFHRDIAGSTVVTFDGLGHVPHEEDPARSIVAVQEFLRGRP